jgi:acetyl esterase/lipase
MKTVLKKFSLWSGIMLFSAILLISCKKYTTGESFSVIHDISYGPDTSNKLDLYLPYDRGDSTPLVIMIHGGGWVTGDKNSLCNFAEDFARNGIAGASLNYRYPDNYKGIHYEQMLEDISMAVHYLSDSSARYHLRKTGFTILGHSSGGHLSLLYAYRNNQDRRIKKAIGYDPVCDLTDTALASFPGMSGLILVIVGSSSVSSYMDASPYYKADSTSVPTLCFHGTKDEIFPYHQSVRLIEKLDSVHVHGELILLQNSPHLSNDDYPQVLSESIRFIRE